MDLSFVNLYVSLNKNTMKLISNSEGSSGTLLTSLTKPFRTMFGEGPLSRSRDQIDRD
jgi:hypothetical protein